MAHPDPAPGPAGNDLERLMLAAREAQAANPVEDAPERTPNLFLWAAIAIALVLTSLAIHFFWPAS
ncbi:hypothetical protein HKD27_14700 [Gluconobacter sp. R75690]|uniref:hypothetical protein n=1 Tax=unclassified Gluconobacter TaxID=2644261 RepID=UPI00188CFA7D|nr:MULTISPECIES: hypothetical protein [unclassified Gluconobacter]MBF0852141.1 hypothetical protein [Gluconobacter sp. R75690]MBF0880805.1 hypothetical protein [Gluconobacter sp. R75828]